MLLAPFVQMRPSSNVTSEKEITENVCVVGGPREGHMRMVNCHGCTSLAIPVFCASH